MTAPSHSNLSPAEDADFHAHFYGCVLEALSEIPGASGQALDAAVIRQAARWNAPCAVIVSATSTPFQLAANYWLDGTPLSSLPVQRGIRIPNRWTVTEALMHRALPHKPQWLSRSFLERNAYPTFQAVDYYANFGYASWMEFPLSRADQPGAKITFMQVTQPSESKLLESTAQLETIRAVWEIGILHRTVASLMEERDPVAPVARLGQALSNLLPAAAPDPTRLSHSARRAWHHLHSIRRLASHAAPREAIQGFGSPNAASGISVLLCTVNAVTARGLENLLPSDFTVSVVTSPSVPRGRTPQVILLDLDGGFSLDDLPAMRAAYPEAAILMLAARPSPSQLGNGSRCGVRGFIPLGAGPGEFSLAIQRLASGRTHFHESMSAWLDIGSAKRLLSEREREVLARAGAGRLNKEIAAELSISLATVETHLRRASAKLGTRSRIEAITSARQRGEIE